MSTLTGNTEECLANGRNLADGIDIGFGVDAAAKSIPMAPRSTDKSVPLAPSSVVPAGVPIASGESVMTRGSDGNFVVEAVEPVMTRGCDGGCGGPVFPAVVSLGAK